MYLFKQVLESRSINDERIEGTEIQFKEDNGRISDDFESNSASINSNEVSLTIERANIKVPNRCESGYQWHAGRCRKIY